MTARSAPTDDAWLDGLLEKHLPLYPEDDDLQEFKQSLLAWHAKEELKARIEELSSAMAAVTNPYMQDSDAADVFALGLYSALKPLRRRMKQLVEQAAAKQGDSSDK